MFRTLKICLVLTTVLLPTIGFALRDDSHEKIHIVSDHSVYNYKTGLTIYEGHVKADQGTTHILADKITTQSANHHMNEVIAYGLNALATCTTLPKYNEPALQGNAKVIKFYPSTSQFIFEQNVTISQGENSFKGERILYNRDNQTILVPNSSKGKSVLVYKPEQQT